mmetsp:Transcript_5780/g.18250  ORF Transcript_5780/g.18250 Transcript_5780/m.18250 type:complete len:391 (+) Transcript_5780:909-2081(+)
MVHVVRRQPRVHRAHVGPHRLRAGVLGLRPHFGKMHADNLHAVCDPDGGLCIADARRLSSDVPPRPHRELSRGARRADPFADGHPRHRVRDGPRRHAVQGDGPPGEERAQGVRRCGCRRGPAGDQEAAAGAVPEVSGVRRHLQPRRGAHRDGAAPVRRLGDGDERRGRAEERARRPVGRARAGHRQPTVLGGRGVLVLRGPGARVAGRVLQRRRRVAHAVRHGLESVRPVARADRGRHAVPDPRALSLLEGAQVHLVQRRQARAVALPREARPGQAPAEPGHADPELLPRGLLHVPGLHRLHGGRDQVGADVRGRDRRGRGRDRPRGKDEPPGAGGQGRPEGARPRSVGHDRRGLVRRRRLLRHERKHRHVHAALGRAGDRLALGRGWRL